NLIIAMCSAAVQGVWAYYSRVRTDGKARIPITDGAMVINSCWMWREDGPFVKRIEEAFKELQKAETSSLREGEDS
ncbi:MAG: hypothetical protein PHY31_06725, partial [Smithellaceae bacterium]|nr:hypothetical protein [Smithellaceae bacterium]